MLNGFIFLALIAGSYGSGLSDITSNLLLGQTGDMLAAFGDFNADKLTDIFVITSSGHELELLLAQESRNDMYQRIHLLTNSSLKNERITSVTPGDFDGDSQMDVLITTNVDNGVKAKVFWGQNGTSLELEPEVIEKTMRDQPLVMDWNGNMLPDLLAESADGSQRLLWETNFDRKFQSQEIMKSQNEPFRKLHSNSFVDLNHDFAADLVINGEDKFEIWYNQDGKFTFNNTELDLPATGIKIIGQSEFVDIDQDSYPDHLLPVCMDDACKDSRIYVNSGGKWKLLVEKFTIDDSDYGFVPSSENKAKDMLGLDIPISIRTGDFDMDGYPDAVVLLKENKASSPHKAFILRNVGCAAGQVELCQDNRTFTVWDTVMNDVTGAMIVAFFDIYEDGILDIFLVVQGDNKIALRAFKNTISADANFIKITVVSGNCTNDCPHGRKPYGVNQPGPTVKYETTKPNGAPTQGSATQLYQSAHFALHLPYVIFGLGAMPNFVDELSVGIPMSTEAPVARKKTWPQIIPNSQLIVIPYPHDRPSSWQMKLFVTPSEAIMITGAVLVGTLGVTAAIVGGLHWRERQEDKEEKKQEAQKFHFDAM